MKYIVYILSLILASTFFSCKRKSDKVTTDPSAKLSFSQDEITFDTIFSTVGSVTKRLWVYNDNSHAVNISNIRLGKLYSSSYKIIVDGEEKTELSDYEVKGKDSVLILVKVLINPYNQSLAYLVSDSIVFNTNGNIQDVDLIAYGQDANFFTNTTVACNSIWTNTKPYVINGNVIVPVGCTLTIDKGCRVKFHKDATLIVKGSLITLGEKDSIVTFAHDNLSNYYADLAGQWNGIVFKSGSKNNSLLYTEIKNATNAITLKEEIDGDTVAELKIENTVIKNCSENGITAANTDFHAVNSLIANCAGYVFKTSSGGNYYFDFCTMANFSYDFFREQPILRLSNKDGDSANDLFARLRNTILWGDRTNEVEQNNNSAAIYNFTAEYSIIKSSATISGTNNLNQDPLFENEYTKNFKLSSSSPAINTGITLPVTSIDLTGNTRDATPDRGCYED